MRFLGHVVSGVGGAARSVMRDDRIERIRAATGIHCVPGTLNVEIGARVDLGDLVPALDHLFPGTPPHLGPARVFKAKITRVEGARTEPCLLFRHVGTSLLTKLEIMAASRLRESMALRDGDQVDVVIYSSDSA